MYVFLRVCVCVCACVCVCGCVCVHSMMRNTLVKISLHSTGKKSKKHISYIKYEGEKGRNSETN